MRNVWRCAVALLLALALVGPLRAGPGGAAPAAACAVTSTADTPGGGTLRERLADPGCDTITFDLPGRGPWTIALTGDLPPLTRTVRVAGPGAARLTVDRARTNGPATAFLVGARGDLTLAGLTLTGAYIGVNVAGGGAVTVADGAFRDDSIGLHLGPGAQATLTQSAVSATDTGILFADGGSATVTGSTFGGNSAGLSFQQGGAATVTGSTFRDNAYGLYFPGGGAATVLGSTFRGNRLAALSLFSGASATVAGSTLTGNGDGLALAPGSSATVLGSTLSENRYGVYLAQSGSATVIGSTLSGNVAGIYLFAGGSATLANSTLAGNGHGLYFDGGGEARLANALLARGGQANCAGGTPVDDGHNLADDPSCFPGGANGSAVVAAGQAGLDPAGLADNGGPTRTIALRPGSPAIAAGDDAVCAAAPVGGVDQRWAPRPQGGRCDSGAYEAGPAAPGPVPSPAPPSTAPAPCPPGTLSFPQAPGLCVAGWFKSYWEQHGGLALNGYPLTDAFDELLEDGRLYRVQYFERVRLEYHPEIADPAQRILLGQFGRHFHPADPPVPPRDGDAYFAATGHNVGPGFYAYWQAHGGLAQFGLPLSEAFAETLEDGHPYTVQYFERARFEAHPENPPPADILLGQFGRRILAER